MNRNQLVSLWVGVTAEVGVLLCPPWVQWGGGLQWIGRTWAWIGAGPAGDSIDLATLGVECLAIALVTAALIVSFRQRRRQA